MYLWTGDVHVRAADTRVHRAWEQAEAGSKKDVTESAVEGDTKHNTCGMDSKKRNEALGREPTTRTRVDNE